MNTMEITKYVGAFCGSLLVFLLLSTAAHSIFDTSSDVVAYSIPVEEVETEGEGDAVADIDVAALVAEADPAEGEGQFRKCASCHKIDGSDGVGPHLDGVVGRPKATVEGFDYSAALASAGGDWTAEDLFGFIENPKGYLPGTAMNFAGIKSPEDRASIIAYLSGTSG
jgi:cytochrome c